MIVRTEQRMAPTLRLLGACALVSVTGCFSLGRPTPPLEAYVLGQAPRSMTAVPVRDGRGVTVGLRRLDLAPYLATTAIVVRRGSRVVSSGFRQWGEDPSAGIMRSVAASLGAAPAILAVDVAPWTVQSPHDYLVQLHVAHLEGVTVDDSTAKEGEVRVTASWEIIRALDGTLVARGETDRREPGWKVGDYAGLVAKIDNGLAGLAGELAACIGRLGSPTPAPDSTAARRPVVCRAP